MSRSLEGLFLSSPPRCEWQSPNYPLSEDPALVGFEWAMNETHNFLRCGRCQEIVAGWPFPAPALTAPVFEHKCPRAGETIEPCPEGTSPIETVRATAFAYYYTHVRNQRMKFGFDGEPIEAPNEKELQLVSADAMILADDAAKKYAEQLAKRAKKNTP